MPRTHLMLAMTRFAFGEVLYALRLARGLAAKGDRVLFLAPTALGSVLDGAPIRFGALDDISRADEAVFDVLGSERVASLVLVDATQVFLGLLASGRHERFLARVSVPVVALDMWNLAETNLQWDTATGAWPIWPAAARLPRLLPVPFIRPDAGPGVFCALPPPRARAPRGSHKRILVTTALWQTVAAQPDAYHRHLAAIVPPRILAMLTRLGDEVTIDHVGPMPLVGGERVTGYRFHPQMPAEAFQSLVAESDLLVSLNVAATTIATALRYDVPVVAVTNSRSLDPPAALAPLRPFAVWPMGLRGFLEPVLHANPYTDAIDVVELTDEALLEERCRLLLGDSAVAALAARRRAAYLTRVEGLPSVGEAFESQLAAVSSGTS
jgi:hypothetical protein